MSPWRRAEVVRTVMMSSRYCWVGAVNIKRVSLLGGSEAMLPLEGA
jgi:hypothetical protein